MTDEPITKMMMLMERQKDVGLPALFTSPDDRRDFLLNVDREAWQEMGEPDELTVSIEPGDVLNPSGEGQLITRGWRSRETFQDTSSSGTPIELMERRDEHPPLTVIRSLPDLHPAVAVRRRAGQDDGS